MSKENKESGGDMKQLLIEIAKQAAVQGAEEAYKRWEESQITKTRKSPSSDNQKRKKRTSNQKQK